MKAVQLITSGDYMSHYMVDDHESWKEEVRIHEGYGLDRFEYTDIPRPEPGLGQVVVQIKACGLKPFGRLGRQGSQGCNQGETGNSRGGYGWCRRSNRTGSDECLCRGPSNGLPRRQVQQLPILPDGPRQPLPQQARFRERLGRRARRVRTGPRAEHHPRPRQRIPDRRRLHAHHIHDRLAHARGTGPSPTGRHRACQRCGQWRRYRRNSDSQAVPRPSHSQRRLRPQAGKGP